MGWTAIHGVWSGNDGTTKRNCYQQVWTLNSKTNMNKQTIETRTRYEGDKISITKVENTNSDTHFIISGDKLYSNLIVNTAELVQIKYLIQDIIDEK